MKLCVAIPCFFKGDFAEAVRKVAALGFNAVETYRYKDLDIPAVKQALEETGVSLLSICTSFFDLTDPQRREEYLQGIKESCEAAAALGVKKMITQVGQDTGAPREEQHASIVAGLKEAAHILASYGITLMIEPLNVLVNHPGYYLTSAAEAFAIIKEVNSPFVKVVYDIYHQQITEGNIIPTVTENLAYIAHLHGAGHPGRHEMWQGESDYRNILTAIKQAGYEGYFGLEYFPLLDPIESLKTAKELYGSLL